MRRCSSCIRSEVRATSMPPLSVKTPALAVLAHGIERQLRHLLGVVDREDEVRRVAGRATRVRQRPLVEQHEVGPAELGEMADEAVADDAGADHDRARGRRGGKRSQSWRLIYHASRSTSRIASSKCSTWARISTAARSPLPRAIASSSVVVLEHRALQIGRPVERERPDPQRVGVVPLECLFEELVVAAAVDRAVDPLVEVDQQRGRHAAASPASSSSSALISSRSARVARSAASRAASGSSTARTSHSRARSRTSTVVTNIPRRG